MFAMLFNVSANEEVNFIYAFLPFSLFLSPILFCLGGGAVSCIIFVQRTYSEIKFSITKHFD